MNLKYRETTYQSNKKIQTETEVPFLPDQGIENEICPVDWKRDHRGRKAGYVSAPIIC